MASFDLNNQKFNKNNKTPNQRLAGIIIVLICSLLFLILFTSFFVDLQNILLGVFGLAIFPTSLIAFAVGIALINNKKYVMPKSYVIYLSISVLAFIGILNLIILGKPDVDVGQYLAMTFNFKFTGGGIVLGILLVPFLYILGLAGSLIIWSIVLIIFVALVIDFLHSVKVFGFESFTKRNKQKEIKSVEVIDTKQKKEHKFHQKHLKPKTEKEQFNLFLDKKLEEQQNTEAKIKLGLIQGNLDSEKSKTERPKSLKEILLTPPEIDYTYYNQNSKVSNRQQKETEIQSNFSILKKENPNNHFIPKNYLEETKFDIPLVKESFAKPEEKPTEIKNENLNVDFFEENDVEKSDKELMQELYPDHQVLPNEDENTNNGWLSGKGISEQQHKKPKEFAQLEMEESEDMRPRETKELYRLPPRYKKPPIELLENRPVDLDSLNEDIIEKKLKLEQALAQFDINAKVIGVVVGPAVTRYELEMPFGISVKKIIVHESDIALALASRSGIRIEAPIPGKSAVGIEVPNDKVAMVNIRDIIDSVEFKNEKSPVAFALGKDIGGNNRVCNIMKMPHLLVAGTTNSGKSICLNSIIISLIYRSSPEDVRLILVDPKKVEFTMYNDVPHLMMPKVITEVGLASNALSWAIAEMERRYVLFQENRCRKVEDYNYLPKVLSGEEKKMPMIVIIVDELADLLSNSKKEVEDKIQRLAQKARAAGIYLVLATQRPSVDVITGVIKSNLPARITFMLQSANDSKTILNQGGAETLLGKGDMLYYPPEAASPSRIQGCFVSNEEVEKVVEYVKANNPSEFDEETIREIENPDTYNQVVGAINDPNFDPLFAKVLKFCVDKGQTSTSSVQTQFLVGYQRATRILNQMERAGYISKLDGAKPRKVFLTAEQFFEKFGQVDY